MKKFLFFPFFLFSFSLFAQVSFQYETRNFNQLGLTTNEQIATYLQIELSDLLPVSQHSSMRGQFVTLSPADLYNIIATAFRGRDIAALLRISKELGVTFERFMIVFSREMDDMPEADLQLTLAMYRIGVKWGIILL